MKINVVCVGKIKEKYFTDAINEYAKRISRFAEFKVIECAEFPVKNQSAAEVLQSVEKEGEKILECVKGYVILTAIDGKMLDSVEISRLMSVKMTEGVSDNFRHRRQQRRERQSEKPRRFQNFFRESDLSPSAYARDFVGADLPRVFDNEQSAVP